MDLAISSHLLWISQHPRFVPYNFIQLSGITYYESMQFLYTQQKCFLSLGIVETLLRGDLRHYNESIEFLNAITKQVSSVKNTDFFVTIGFNHQTYSISKCTSLINNLIKCDWVISCRAIFEFHRENGEHPHAHFYLCTNQQYKSKIVEKIWAIKGIKSICLKKSFIDCKSAAPYHKDYINLNKTESKLQYIEKDRIWRLANSIPEYFEK